MPKANVIAVVISDLHLSLMRPSCRNDKDWMEVQASYLAQVKKEAGNLPVLCAGDIFDRWNPPPELINFALQHLPDNMISVPGQHDLPNHRIDAMHRSGYGVLVAAEKIVDLHAAVEFPEQRYSLHGFGWGQPIEPPDISFKTPLKIAIIHKYCWAEDKKYPNAPEEANVGAYKKQLKGYDVAFFGDNHKRFMAQAGNCTVVNVGGFMRRKSDEIGRKPCMALLHSDGTVSWKKLDTSKDTFQEDVLDRPEVPINMKQFIDELQTLGEQGLDFRAAVEDHLRNDEIEKGVKEIIYKALESHGSTD